MAEETQKAKSRPLLKYFWIVLIVILLGVGFYYSIIKHTRNSRDSIKANAVSGRQIDTTAPVGSKAPDFTLSSTTDEEISLSDYYGKKSVLLYFQEGVMCDPCWEQIVDIEKQYDKFKEMNMEVLTITVDPLNGLVKNAQSFGINLPILADENLEVSSKYGVLEDSMHPGSRPGHSFILVDTSGNIIWKKAYFIASGNTKMNMRGMEMDMGMDMGTPDSVMYLPVNRLLKDLRMRATQAGLELTTHPAEVSMNMSNTNMSVKDHSMCLTPIHYHTDFKMYLAGTMLNFSQNNYMDQNNVVHFHKTVKIKPEDIPNIPNGNIIHTHKEDVTLREFLKTLDLPFNIDEMQNLKVYVNGDLQTSELGYVIKDKDRILITDSTNDQQVEQQIESVTDYAVQGKEKNPSLFGGC